MGAPFVSATASRPCPLPARPVVSLRGGQAAFPPGRFSARPFFIVAADHNIVKTGGFARPESHVLGKKSPRVGGPGGKRGAGLGGGSWRPAACGRIGVRSQAAAPTDRLGIRLEGWKLGKLRRTRAPPEPTSKSFHASLSPPSNGAWVGRTVGCSISCTEFYIGLSYLLSMYIETIYMPKSRLRPGER